ncbi:MAG: hypothetical protein ACYC1Z_00950 [Georgenia sp.]
MRDRRSRGCAGGVLVLLATLVLALGAVVVALNLLVQDRPSGTCTVTLDDATTWSLDADQADNAALLGAVAARRDLPARATTIAIATALQESKLRNVDYGDRDSVGLFQQRPSQGWGTVEQVMDPVYSTNAFYDVLVTVEGWQGREITDAAQRVQRSAFPEAYAQHEPRGRAFASALSGYSPAALTCHLDAVGDGAADGAAADGGSAGAAAGDPASRVQRLDVIQQRITRDFGIRATVAPGGVLTVDATALPGGLDPAPERQAWGVAQWAVASSSATGAGVVAVDGQVWLRTAGNDAAWAPLDGADVPAAVATAAAVAPAGTVVIG